MKKRSPGRPAQFPPVTATIIANDVYQKCTNCRKNCKKKYIFYVTAAQKEGKAQTVQQKKTPFYLLMQTGSLAL